MFEIVAPVDVIREKSAISTPDTDSENVTVKSTTAALVGLGFTGEIEITDGEILSIL